MITKFKIFNFKSQPTVGDYAICEIDSSGYFEPRAIEMAHIIKNNIGEIIDYKKKSKSYHISYENIPDNLKGGWFLSLYF